MCWLLTVAGPPTAALPKKFRSFGGGSLEPEAAVTALFPSGDVCRRIGDGCACSLYRAEATEAELLRRTAARRGWPDKLLRQRLERIGDWVGLDPSVREAVAAAAQGWGRVGVYLRWPDANTPAVAGRSFVTPDRVRDDPACIAPGWLVTVRAATGD